MLLTFGIFERVMKHGITEIESDLLWRTHPFWQKRSSVTVHHTDEFRCTCDIAISSLLFISRMQGPYREIQSPRF